MIEQHCDWNNPPSGWLQSIVMVCLSVCLLAHIENYAVKLTKLL